MGQWDATQAADFAFHNLEFMYRDSDKMTTVNEDEEGTPDVQALDIIPFSSDDSARGTPTGDSASNMHRSMLKDVEVEELPLEPCRVGDNLPPQKGALSCEDNSSNNGAMGFSQTNGHNSPTYNVDSYVGMLAVPNEARQATSQNNVASLYSQEVVSGRSTLSGITIGKQRFSIMIRESSKAMGEYVQRATSYMTPYSKNTISSFRQIRLDVDKLTHTIKVSEARAKKKVFLKLYSLYRWCMQMTAVPSNADINSYCCMRYTSLGFLHKDHALRRFCMRIIISPAFETSILLLIIFACVLLTLESPRMSSDSKTYKLIQQADDVTSVIFMVEMILKIIAL
ncbi:mitochondrial thiamine pyrophosphate transporter [Cymbomonas tetramitiformis]|uniref:Mitochondrial thiamine pyrophosphate transporter n=1 Tax=Cymbomonas tetramitiformis TaxID=36881 RepID=A0AAE0FI10_9CHLO|nr:mitochondrial thiamine pyrophosphate transporter [Cymbomonas tetramitiformis]